jgi:hypothetical protein
MKVALFMATATATLCVAMINATAPAVPCDVRVHVGRAGAVAASGAWAPVCLSSCLTFI